MTPYKIYGANGSPYSMKVRAALRAKRLPYSWTSMTAEQNAEIMPKVKAPVVPIIETPEGTWLNDSTPFLLGIEGEGRTLLPDDPMQRFACLLLEDMADEWFMKAMFHYRWAYSADAEWCANWLMYDSLPNKGLPVIKEAAANIRARQISRMALVGCTPETGPLIEASWQRCNRLLETMATGPTRFLFGNRPSLADFGFFGQLMVMSTDPTPMAWLREHVPYLYRWLIHADDASGIDGDWDDGLSEPVKGLLKVAGETYLPFLIANATALQDGKKTFSLTIEGGTFTQGTFGYQAKCLLALRTAWADLAPAAQQDFRTLIGPGSEHLDAK